MFNFNFYPLTNNKPANKNTILHIPKAKIAKAIKHAIPKSPNVNLNTKSNIILFFYIIP